MFGIRLACPSTEPSGVRIATFNIEDFPKDDRQIAGADDAGPARQGRRDMIGRAQSECDDGQREVDRLIRQRSE